MVNAESLNMVSCFTLFFQYYFRDRKLCFMPFVLCRNYKCFYKRNLVISFMSCSYLAKFNILCFQLLRVHVVEFCIMIDKCSLV